MFTIKDGIFCIRQEILRCKDNPSDDLSLEQMQSFIDGLEQSIYILNKLDKNEVVGGDVGTSTSHYLILPKS
jgi:hypothetical protein